MLEQPGFLLTALLIIVVVMVFNLIIFVHELGHFWAAKWRGLKIDRFQIWFGKPIWSKTINGVQYGLGWIPAGGFVALPQMAPMGAIEGQNSEGEEPLPPISPLDKIIVAFAGPFFSFLLALAAALVIYVIQKPIDVIHTTTIGWVQHDSPAEKAGLQRNDKILAINDEAVENWNMPLNSVFMNIVTSKGDRIHFTVERPEKGVMEIFSEFKIPESNSIFERKKTREVGLIPIRPNEPVKITGFSDDPNAPAKLAGFEVGDVFLKVNGQDVVQYEQVTEAIQLSKGESMNITILRGNQEMDISVKPAQQVPDKPSAKTTPQPYMLGASFEVPDFYEREWVKPTPFEQITETVKTMWITITTVASPKSSIGIQHLSGPVGIGKIQYYSLLMDNPLHRILAFMVLININLAILNMLPFPVLDGGHITIATMEAIARRPVNIKFLEVLQIGFVVILFSIMLYVTSKDVFDDFGMGSEKTTPMSFPKPASE